MQKRSGPIEDMIMLLMQHLDKYSADSSKVCNLGNLLHYFAFDVSALATCGHFTIILTI